MRVLNDEKGQVVMRATYTSFAQAATALGFKVKPVVKKEKEMLCPKCGKEMRNVTGTNVWFCDWATLEEKPLEEDFPVQVFTPCGNRVLAAD